MSKSKEQVLATLVRAKEILQDPSNWTTAVLAEDKDGNVVSPASEEAVCFCSLGALAAASVEIGTLEKEMVGNLSVEGVYNFIYENVPGVDELADAFIDADLVSLRETKGSSIWFAQDNLYQADNHEKLMEVFDNAIKAAKEKQ